MRKATVHQDFSDAVAEVEISDESIVVDENVITGQGLGAAIPFALKLVEIIVGKEKADQNKKAICYKG